MSTTTDSPRMWTRDTLAEHLELEFITKLRDAQGSIPSERFLSESLGVSRSLVREVLRGFEQRGIVDIIPGKGAFARNPSQSDLVRAMHRSFEARNSTFADFAEARETIEVETARLSARRATSEDIRSLSRALADLEASNSLVERAIADIAFHCLVARASHNQVLTTLFDSISAQILGSILRSLADGSMAFRDTTCQKLVLASIIRAEPNAAAEAMALHLHKYNSLQTSETDDRLTQIVTDVLQRTYGRSVSLDELVAEAINHYSEENENGRGNGQ